MTRDTQARAHAGLGSRRGVVALALAVLVAVVASGCALVGPRGRAVYDRALARPVGPVTHEGRWFTDLSGRVWMPRGFSIVNKGSPFYPSAMGFGDDDAAFLASEGFTAVRVGVEFQGLMPEPGVVDHAYIGHIVDTVRTLARHGIYSLIDFHQDGYGPVVGSNGFPAWATITDGLPNPPIPFPLYYAQNPALQRAFDHFWENSPAPNGVGLQDLYVQGAAQLASALRFDPYVLGWEPMNEPWPGTDWQTCVTGCADIEARTLVPFYEKFTAAVRGAGANQMILPEPFVLFNFGGASTDLPAFGTPQNGLAVHDYPLSPDKDADVIAHALDAVNRNGDALLVTEFGATLDPAALRHNVDLYASTLVPWLEWAYNEGVIGTFAQPAGWDNLASRDAFLEMDRPYAVMVAGTPTAEAYAADTSVYTATWSPVTPDGRHMNDTKPTSIWVPSAHYPHGYTVSITGGTVTSPPCAPYLTVRNQRGASSVSVSVSPGGTCSR